MEKECDLCNATEKKFVKEENGYPIVKCLNCSLLFVNRVLALKKEGVVDEYYFGGESEIESNRLRYSCVSKFLMSEINRRCDTKGRLLDVGCGFGFFLVEAKRYGWDVYGTDLSSFSINFARKENRLENVYCSDLSQLQIPKNHFTVINMTNILEHVPYPTKILNECYDLLEENGILIVRVPNMIFTLFFEYFRPILEQIGVLRPNSMSILASAPPIHLHGFSPKSLKKYFGKVGFDTMEIKPSKLSAVTSNKIGIRIFETVVLIIYLASFRQINLSPTILAIAKK